MSAMKILVVWAVCTAKMTSFKYWSVFPQPPRCTATRKGSTLRSLSNTRVATPVTDHDSILIIFCYEIMTRERETERLGGISHRWERLPNHQSSGANRLRKRCWTPPSSVVLCPEFYSRLEEFRICHARKKPKFTKQFEWSKGPRWPNYTNCAQIICKCWIQLNHSSTKAIGIIFWGVFDFLSIVFGLRM